MNIQPQTVVCGAGGFIGGHLVKGLLDRGVRVIRAIDIKPLEDWHQITEGVENLSLDLKEKKNCLIASRGADHVYQLAADMGGMGFIEKNKILCMLNVLTSTNMLVAAREMGVQSCFYASSACVYNAQKQAKPDAITMFMARMVPRQVDGKGRPPRSAAKLFKLTSPVSMKSISGEMESRRAALCLSMTAYGVRR